MVASASTPADIINLSLRRMGYSLRIGSLYDGSDAANAALDIYAQTRDELLRQENWDFAEKIASAVVTGGTPPGIWTAEYTYPTDCLKVRNMYNSAYVADPTNPIPPTWTIGNASGVRVIWSTMVSAILVYTMQLTNPAQMDPDFIEALAASLGRRLAPVLVGMDAVKVMAEDEISSIEIARSVIG